MPARTIRAHGVAISGIIKFPAGPYLVPSARIPEHHYIVEADLSSCNCADAFFRKVICKHVTGTRLALEMGIVTKGRIEAAPAAPVKPAPTNDPFANFDEAA